MEVQGGEKLDTLAAVATDGTEIEDTANNPSGARQKTNSSGQYVSILQPSLVCEISCDIC